MGNNGDLVGPHAEGVMEQPVDDEMILFNPATEAYFTLNRSAREVWELADGTLSVEEITGELAKRYGMDQHELSEDVVAIIASFRDASLI